MSLIALSASCRGITEKQLPDGVMDPAAYNNREGATLLTRTARSGLVNAISTYIVSSGLLTDELSATGAPSAVSANRDQRSGHWYTIGPPHSVRALARLARGVVRKYVPGETSGWQAQLLMYEAYAEILTADGWCSGVPLSTLDFEGDWTYKSGSTTAEIYAHAITLLDSADALATDSVAVQSAIRVLTARAQLALGYYADAAQTVQGIDAAFRYTIRIAFDGGGPYTANSRQYSSFISGASIADHEGMNGLPYLSSGDPRTRAISLTHSGRQSFFPEKYVTTTDSSTFTLASGVEAHLIMAEAALHADDPPQMVTRLNALRTSGTYTVDTTALAGGGERIDTLWDAGLGGIAGLRPLALPPTPEAQRQLLFAERAAWLFATGIRQGDLRRLVRVYGLNRESVYPTGTYTVPGYTGVYGTAIEFGLDERSESRNPLFTGCQYAE